MRNQTNRPVHLARRDAFFERAVELLYAPQVSEPNISERLKQIRLVYTLLKHAVRHAFLTSGCDESSERERDFLHFLELIAQNVQAAYNMMLNQMHLEEDASFLRNFLGTDDNEYALPALAYGRRAEDIMRALWHVLRLALNPYRMLQRESMKDMDEKQLTRYRKALEVMQQDLNSYVREITEQSISERLEDINPDWYSQ